MGLWVCYDADSDLLRWVVVVCALWFVGALLVAWVSCDSCLMWGVTIQLLPGGMVFGVRDFCGVLLVLWFEWFWFCGLVGGLRFVVFCFGFDVGV